MSVLRASGRVQSIWDRVITSFWFVPTIMMVVALLLTGAGLAIDLSLTQHGRNGIPWWVYVSTPDEARSVVSTLLSSTITMATLVFTITMVVLTLAARQFGPRLVRNFMASRQTQVVLGTFVMTILYCLLILSAIGHRGTDGPVPFATVTGAMTLVGLSVGLLVLFIHTLGRSIVSETIIERVGRELDALIGGLPPLANAPPADPEEALPNNFEEHCTAFGSKAAGYIQAIDFERLVDVATRCDVVIGLYFRPGDYAVEGGRGISVWPMERFDPKLPEDVHRAIVMGSSRTPVQDPEFPLRHLVEIAVRALSPGTNDPYTAVAVLQRLSASLSRLMGRELPPGVFRDDAGNARVICPRPTYRTLVSAAFDQVRQNGADKPLVVIHILEAIVRIAEHARLPEQIDALREQLSNIREDAERAIPSAADRKDVGKRCGKADDSLRHAFQRISDSAGSSGAPAERAL